MADVEITVTISEVFKLVAQRTSVATETDPFYANMTTEQRQYSQLHGESDRLTLNLLKEAAKEVLRCFISRQGDVVGIPYEVTATTIAYRFNEAIPVLTQAPAIKIRLTENTRDAIVYFIMAALYKTDGNINKLTLMQTKCIELINELTGDLYRLHD